MLDVIYFCLCSSTLLLGVSGSEFVSVMKGDSVTLSVNLTETQIKEGIYWKFGPNKTSIAKMNEYKTTIYNDRLDGRFKNRLHLNNQTGSLTITNIKTTDSGLYNITTMSQDEPLKIFNVYARLPVPVITSNSSQCSSSSSSSTCSLLCSVLNVRDVSLSWYKGNSLLSIISVSDLNIRLSLPLEVEYQDTNTYRCVLNNTNTNQTQHLNIKNLCQTCSDTTVVTGVPGVTADTGVTGVPGVTADTGVTGVTASIQDHIVEICCAVVGFLIIVTAVLIFSIYGKHKNTKQQAETIQSRGDEIVYADPTFCKRQTHKTRASEEDDVVYASVKR